MMQSPAKLNLFLHVTGRRANGYHELQSVFVAINLYDEIDCQWRSDQQLIRTTDLGFASDQDLMIKAARAMQQYHSFGLDIAIQKQIPMGAGLGGGSSNAATILQWLNQHLPTPLSPLQLRQVAMQLGADVPFFLMHQPCLVEGLGEQLTPISLPKMYFVVICPAVHVPTQQIFQHPKLPRQTALVPHATVIRAINQFGRLEHGGVLWGKNDLEEVACRLYPELHELRSYLHALGLPARMSGSGGTFFIPCHTLTQAQAIHEQLWERLPVAITTQKVCFSL